MTGSDRQQLTNMAGQAKETMGVERLDVLADRGYFSARKFWPAKPWARRLSCQRP